MKRHLLVVNLCLIALVVCPLYGQLARTYEKFVMTAEFRDALRMANEGRPQQAVDKFHQIAAVNPGTTIAAESLFQVARLRCLFQDRAKCLAAYREVIDKFPGSRFEVRARSYSVDVTVDRRRLRDLWLHKQEEILSSYGAPTVRELIQARSMGGLTARVQGQPIEIQVGLLRIYTLLEIALGFESTRYDEAIAVGIFCRQTFSGEAFEEYSSKSMNFLQWALVQRARASGRSANWESPPVINPTIVRRGPRAGQETGNRRPKIWVEITDGDYEQPQVNLAKVQFTVGGQDLTSTMKIDSKLNLTLQSGKVFERLRITARPSQPLPPGIHEVKIVAPVNGYRGEGPGIATMTWTLTVIPGDDDRDDDEGEDCH
ncbi:MAG: hypothetical protein AMXMBFR33_58120 [Candidatus Xenobia bacterium]